MATLQRLARPCRHLLSSYTRCRTHSRMITTTDKKKDIITHANEDLLEKSEEFQELEKHFGDADPEKLKNWQSYGWDNTDRENDTFHANLMNFSFFTIMIVLYSFVIAYMPDYKMRDWSVREAYLEMDRREKAGLPLIDPYLVPPEQVELPTEEELGDQEIII